MRIYIAAPLFSRAELDFNDTVASELRRNGFDVFLPQETGFPEEIPESEEGRRRILLEAFSKDIDGIRGCDILLIVMDGRVPDEGACFELGYAYASGKICVGLKTDTRVSELGLDNAMLTGSLGDNIARDIPSLIVMLKSIEVILTL